MNPWAKTAMQGGACGLMLGMVVLIGGRLWQPQVAATQAKQSAVAEVVRARRFEMVDQAGKVRAKLTTFVGLDPRLDFYDAAGTARATLTTFPDGDPALVFHDAAGKTRAVLGTTEDGNSSLSLSDKAGILRAVLGATSLETVNTAEVTLRPESSLVLFDKDGKMIWRAP